MLQGRLGSSSALPHPKRLFNGSLGIFFSCKGPGAREMPSPQNGQAAVKYGEASVEGEGSS